MDEPIIDKSHMRIMPQIMILLKRNRVLVAIIQSISFLFQFARSGSAVDLAFPAWFKRRLILRLIKENPIDYFIETGTYLGQTANLVFKRFETITVYSIEIDPDLHFFTKNRSKSEIATGRLVFLHGNSSEALPSLIPKIHGNLMIFLDGHYSSGSTKHLTDCPLMTELDSIAKVRNAKDTIIILDDVHLFGKLEDYPTWTQITKFCREHNYSIKRNGSLAVMRLCI